MDYLAIYRILQSKYFLRLRNKTQLYNAAADDHYHTRLTHTLEVFTISSQIAENCKNAGIPLSIDCVAKIALLHDVGHTPFGHAGERALHDILAGKEKAFDGFPDLISIGCDQGFKHNINSGLIYKRNFPFYKIERKVMDGIINHTKRYYTQDEGDKKLDYGLHYVVSGLNLEYELDKLEPFFIEGFIVSVADEIAQSCSDFLDIVVSGFGSNEDFLNDKPFSNYANRYENTRRIAYHSCKDLVASVSNVFASFGWPLCDEGKEAIKTIIKNSQKTREETIKNNNDLGTFDEQAKKNVLRIYELYFKNPEMLELSSLKEFIFECEDEVQNKIVLNEVKEISKLFITKTDFLSEETTENQDENAMSLSEEDLIKQKIIAFTKHCYEKIVDESIGSNMKKAYQKCYKLFLREIAVTISMMTDSYAINKLEHQSD